MAVVTQTIQDQVTELYLGFFGRAPDAAGFGYWSNALATGGATVQGVANGFAQTPEFVANYGGLTPVQQVTKIYLNVLNRAPDANGLTYWTGLLNSGSSIGSVVYGIVNAAFTQTGTADGLLVQNKVTVGEYFAAVLASNDTALAATAYNLVTSAASSVVAAEAAITQGSGGTWALTTGIDTLTHGPFATFVGTVGAASTLNAGDTITGVGAGNQLKVVDTANIATPMAGVSLTGVQNVAVQSTHVSTNIYDMSTTTGVTKVTSLNSTGGNAGTAINVAFQGLAAGTTVEVAGAASTTGNITQFQYTTATSTPTVTFNGGVNNQTVNATAAGGSATATSAVINSINGVNGTLSTGVAAANTVKLTSGANTIANLAVNAATNLRATLTAGDFAAGGANLTVSGLASNVNLGQAGVFKSVDASGLTAGGVTVGASAGALLANFVGGAGNDSLTNNAAGTATIASTATINAGAGVDTLAASLVNAGNAAVFSGFDILNLATAVAPATVTLDVSLLTNSTITAVSMGATVGATVLSNLVETASGFNVNVAATGANGTTLGFTAASIAGTADVVNYNFAGTAGAAVAAGTVTHQGIEIVNIVSGGNTGTTNSLTITDNALQSVVVTGSQQMTLITSAQAAVGAATATALTTIDASGMAPVSATNGFLFTETSPGAVALVLTGLTVTGSSANDTITVATQSAAGHAATASFGADTVVLTGGGDDIVDVTGAASQIGTATAATAFAFTTVTGANAGDQIVLNGAAGAMAAGTAAVNVSAVGTLLAAANLATNNAVVGTTNWFVFAGNTYVADNVDGVAGLGATDVLVKLTGVYDLTLSSAAAGTMTLA